MTKVVPLEDNIIKNTNKKGEKEIERKPSEDNSKDHKYGNTKF